MNKRTYLQPTCKVNALNLSSTILAGSTDVTAPDAGWADAKERFGEYDDDDDFFDDDIF